MDNATVGSLIIAAWTLFNMVALLGFGRWLDK